MLKKYDIICISSIDWDFIWQGHQEIMSTLAAHGNRVLFIENTGVRSPVLQDLPRIKKRIYNWFHSVKGIRQERENLYIYSPIVLPFPYSRLARWINKRIIISALTRWIKSMGFSNPIIWTFLPTGLVIDIIEAVNNKIVIYHCIDNFAASSSQANKIRKSERRLLAKADIVFVTSKNLYEQCVLDNANVHIFPYGFNAAVYDKAKESAKVPDDISKIKHPIVGYVGGVHKWIDFGLIRFLADKNRDMSFVFIGPPQRDVAEFKDVKNVYFLNQKRYSELPLYISQFDVCIIPYLLTEYTKNVYPTKINEYLYLGKPVVSTAIPEVEAFNSRNNNAVLIGDTNDKFSLLINKAILEKREEVLMRQRAGIALREGSWDAKIENISCLIENEIKDKERDRLLNWKDNLLKLYKTSTKKLAPALGFLLIAYAVIFYTPCIWLIAEPLKISDVPEKADAIVVLAGGVGESGKAKQGYEERVKYAVELYKKGYAGHLIFSSGYTQFFQETLLMKALAVALGVPQEAILLEGNASNTYENIKFTKDILDREKWRKILLVSSPYHMRRVFLVNRKIAPELTVIYTPIPQSSFYSHRTNWGISIRQTLGIMHEYMGIAYYWWKGLI